MNTVNDLYRKRQGQSPTACPPEPCVCGTCGMLECLCRPRFFAGQVLTADDLNRLDGYIRGKHRLHNRQLHGWGVVNGLEVTCNPCGDGVAVGCGYALSPCGDDIVVCEAVSVTASEAARRGLAINQDGARRTLFELMGYPEVGVEPLLARFRELDGFDRAILAQLQCDARYAPYLARQEADVAALRRDEAVALPATLDYTAMPGLSGELREKLARVRPATLGQAARISGVTPAALTALLRHVRRRPAPAA